MCFPPHDDAPINCTVTVNFVDFFFRIWGVWAQSSPLVLGGVMGS